MSAKTQTYYPFLDGFRALAIFWVLIHHLNYFFNLSAFFPRPFSEHFDRFAQLGILGVDIFFVISGFLISGLLFEDLSSRVRMKRFYIRRAFKIFPQYLLAVIIGLILGFLFYPEKQNPVSIASYFFLFQNYVASNPAIPHLWSIAVEEHFYFVYPLIIQGVCLLGRNVQERRRILLIVLLVLIAVVFPVRRYTFITFPYNPLLLFQMTHLRFDALLLGCVIKLLEPMLLGLWFSRSKWFSSSCFVLSMGFFYILFLRFDPCRSSMYVVAYLASGFLLVSALCGFQPLLVLTQNSPMRWVGRSSYAIYLWHYPLIVVFSKLFHGAANVLGILAIAAACVLAGALSTMTIEKYFLNMRKTIAP